MVDRKNLVTNTKRIITGLGLLILMGIMLPASTSSPIFAQQEGIPLRHGRMSKTEAQGRLNFARSEISRMQKAPLKGDFQKGGELKKDLENIISNCDDRASLYQANYLIARFENQNSYFQKNETFRYLETCIFQYSEQEEQFGLAANALLKMSEKSLENGKFIESSRIKTLYSKSPAKTSDGESQIYVNMNDLLMQDIGGLSLYDALQSIFKRDGINIYKKDGFLEGDVHIYAQGPSPKKYGVPEGTYFYKKFVNYREVGIKERSHGPIFPTLIFEDTKNCFDRKVWRRNSSEPYIGEFYVPENTTKDEFLRCGGVDPYNWYPDSENDLNDW